MRLIGSMWNAAFIVVALAMAAPAGSQTAEEDVAKGRAMVEAGRKELVKAELQLGDAEAAAFWPIYDEYRRAATDISDRYTAMIMRYVDRYNAGTLDNAYSDALLEEYFSIRLELLELRRAYIDRFKAAMPSLKVAQFYQLENKINAEIDAQLALAIPLISE